jgi:hypothetical protein
LKEIFGEYFTSIRECPEGFCYEDIREIVLEGKKIGNMQGAIKQFLEVRQPQIKIKIKDTDERYKLEAERDEIFAKDLQNIRQHIHQMKYLYEGENFKEGIGFPWGY